MPDAAKVLILLGLGLLAAGLVVWLAVRVGFHGLPGDINAGGPNVRVYFPVVTCVVVSVLLTAGLWVWQWLTRR